MKIQVIWKCVIIGVLSLLPIVNLCIIVKTINVLKAPYGTGNCLIFGLEKHMGRIFVERNMNDCTKCFVIELH